MEQNQNQTELEALVLQQEEPAEADNSQVEEIERPEPDSSNTIQEEGQSLPIKEEDPSKELILGKFKSVEDLTKAYEELQKHQGRSSEELGFLRKELASFNGIKESINLFNNLKTEFCEVIERDMAKYNAPEYFEDPTFREIYQEALSVYGSNLDTDRMINLLEKYVSMRIQVDEKKKLAKGETQSILDSMSYSKNYNAKFTPPQKKLDEMTPQEIDEMLDRLI